MGGYIGSKASVVSSGAERKQHYNITTTTTSLTGLQYTPTKVHVYHNGIRLVDGTDYTATNGTSITLTNAAEDGDDVVVISYATFQTSDTVSAANGGTFAGNVSMSGALDVAGNVGIGTTSPDASLDVESSGDTRIRISDSRDSSYSVNDPKGGIDFYWADTSSNFPNISGSIEMQSADIYGTLSDMVFKTASNAAATEAMRIDHEGKLGIGTDSPGAALTVRPSGTGSEDTHFGYGANLDAYITTGSNGNVIFREGNGSGTNTERMRIDSNGNLLCGTTNPLPHSANVAGVAISTGSYDGFLAVSRASTPMGLNRITSDGDIIDFRKNGTSFGSIGALGSRLFIADVTDVAGIKFYNNGIHACGTGGATKDNIQDLGAPTARWDDVYATNGTIQTSDQNEKQQIASLTDAEITAAKAISKLFKTFKWNDSVAEKGDAARTHTGVIAQQVETAMTDAGLNAGDYAFFISTTWWETQTEVPAVEADEENGVEAQEAYTRTDTYETAEEAPEGATERNRKGIRYPQLLSFIGAATEQRLASIESRLDALENA